MPERRNAGLTILHTPSGSALGKDTSSHGVSIHLSCATSHCSPAMPLFRASGESDGVKQRPKQRRKRICRKTDEDGSVLPLTHLCLLSLADNMNDMWAKDYADNYLDHYSFRHIMGPFNLLSGELVEELTRLLCNRKQLSRAALHLLLVPQLRALSLEKCPGLVTSALCGHISARCQGLRNLDLSGAHQLPSKAISETLICLPALRSLSLSGTLCDAGVIRTVARHCRFLRHLDISCCHFLSPAALLALGGGASIVSYGHPSSVSNSTSKSPTFPSLPAHFSLPSLCSLISLDIGFGKEEGDDVAAAAFLLLSLPFLERVAIEGLAQACCLIHNRDFNKTNEFTDREGVPRLGEVWRHRQVMDKWSKKREVEEGEKEKKEEEGEILWEGYSSDSEEDSSRDEGPNFSQSQTEKKRSGRVLSQSDDDHLILSLKDAKAVSCDSLDSLSQLCPNIHSISVNIDDNEVTGGKRQWSVLAASLNTWSGQMRNLSLHYLGPVLDLLPALEISGSSLVSLILEGVKTSPHTPLLDVIKACPRLRDLLIFAEPPTTPQEHEEDERGEQEEDQDLPLLSNLCSLTLKFSYEHSQMKPIMSWMSLKKVLKSLLSGSPLLEKLSLVSLPCPLNCVLQDVLHRGDLALHLHVNSTDVPPMPLGQLQHIDLQRTDVEMTTVKSLMQRTKRLKCIDVSYCWKISQAECFSCVTTSKVKLVWS